ncbi:MAG: CHASE2 domain-containing protein [Pseudanabaena sp.]|jgi:CHASE2 domain-containing sensor protein/nitrogen-specific signal transduction histidine kinase|nr:CHASE2 domain-containing protein [Pseudanabaena sp. M53BS1SP1A06MG]MCA6583777.1 CHASE2 domain-containing protein [Pseudanabaena sp. M34BS1SP1A06MG]MCA6593337.1 CHASE2 domain-containing protein [Pseudanabaena sp. M38BS1SP1A06MG]MCA6599517.1 CHASE2 domain-containing protein [Pseudanabaena sp. M57BS1SP1A06MG]MCE2975935.1 CHASE2 domain-containing protein [Pseudanabaena sp. CoA8_M7]
MWSKLKKRIWKWKGFLVIIPVTTGILLGIRSIGLLQPLELATYDLFFQWRPTESIDDRIVIVGISESDIQNFGYPISDEPLTKLLNLIKQQQPRVIGLDIYRDLPVPKNYGSAYQELIKVFASTPNLIGIRKVIANREGSSVAASPILEQRNQVAANDFIPDNDGKIRRILLSLKDQQGKTITSLSAALALQYLQKENIKLEVIDLKAQKYRLGKAIFVPMQENDGGYVRQQLGGYQILSNFRNFHDGFRSVSLTQILNGDIPQDIFRDRLVLIGVTAESNTDYFVTPYNSAVLGNSFPVTSGVTLHANITSQLIAQALDGRPVFKVWSKLIESLWIALWSLFGGLLCWQHYNYRPIAQSKFAFRIPWTTLTIASLGGSLFITSYLAFLWGWWIPIVPALMALFSSSTVITGYIALNVQETRRRAIISAIPDLMFNVSADGIYLGQLNYNRNIELIYPDFENIGKHISQFLMPEICDRHLFHIQQALSTGEIQVYEQRICTDSKCQDEEVRIVVSGANEVLFMIRNISDRKQAELAIYQKNTELANTLKELKTTQKQLVESEKYASLGSMVAGIAHEVNTPVGNSLLAASILEQATQQFDEAFSRGELKKSSLQAYLDKAKISSEILLSNLQRAAELIQNFKQVAVDQSSLEQRSFSVKDYIEKILISLDPQIKYTPHQVFVQGDSGIMIQSFPGALSQIVTNLVMNSLTHAYHGLEKVGHLQFEVKQQNCKVIIVYSDDGKGIPAESLPKIFDPFFTTARNSGGSGLGLHIIYNLITQNLKGNIICKSEIGSGTKFIITLPENLQEINCK